MKHIIKNDPPEKFINWLSRRPNRTWKTLTGRRNARMIKQILWDSLVKEQGYLCCYCERRIESGGHSSHIEHLLPKDDYPEFQLEYNNLLCSCQAEDNEGKLTSNICGHKKKKQLLPIDPLKPICETDIVYTSSGKLKGKNEDAKTTIRRLGLNHYDLKRSRQKIISQFQSSYTKEQINNYLNTDNSRFRIFHTSIKQAYNIM